MTILNNIFNDKTANQGDRRLAFNAMAAAAAGAQAYLGATLQATTPELRAMLAGITTQKLAEHEAMTNYMMNKGWMNPYEQPTEQLEVSARDAETVLGK